MNNEEMIQKLIDERNENCYVIPLYIHINHKYYQLWEMDQIENYSNQIIKVGFGSSVGLMMKSPFPIKQVIDFDIVKTFQSYNYDKEISIRYYVLESGFLTEEELTDDIHKQIQMYVEAIGERVNKIVTEKRMALRKRMMENQDNYINQELFDDTECI
jgi:hypothetical protein